MICASKGKIFRGYLMAFEEYDMGSLKASVFLCLVVLSHFAEATCPAQACYAVSFKVSSCNFREATITPPATKESPSGLLLKADNVKVTAVPCSAGRELWRPVGEPEIARSQIFFYGADDKAACVGLTGKTFTLFAPAFCCDTENSGGACAINETVLAPLPIQAQ